jgi:hypothetical protein
VVSVALPAPTERFLAEVSRVAGGQVAAVYAVGSLALDDFSERQSNVDLVVIADPALDAAQKAQLGRALGPLRHAGRPAEVWYATWEDLEAGGPGSGADLAAGAGPAGAALASPLATPMTRAILRHDPMALYARRLHARASGRMGTMVLRRRIGPVVLECARLAQGAITGRVLSKSEAGEALTHVVSGRYRRVLTDTVGYRRGAQTSMYWGPFERRTHALDLIRELDRTAAEERLS